ncbi:MAG: acetate kinase [Firmicutes bacterium]|nr:acetate kinase [Bacillota bacterium]
MKVLVLNCGSSSAKYKLYDMTDETVLAEGRVERIGLDDALITHDARGKERYHTTTPVRSHQVAIARAMELLTDSKYGVLKSVQEIDAVGHRIVSGGAYFTEPVLVDQRNKELIAECSELAPLHNPGAVVGIEAAQELLPDASQVAVFDTAFLATMEPHVYLYALPYELYEKYKIRRYGAHGTSHKYVALRAAQLLNRPLEELKVITCHLGNGASITAIKDGRCVDTSMGMTPLEGLIMGTRCGSIDPSIPLYIMEREGLTTQQCNDLMNKQSGLKGMSGVSHDMRDIEAAMEEGNERAIQAFKAYVHSIVKHIGAYTAVLGGLDCLVFTAGVGENSPLLRSHVCSQLAGLGIYISEERNHDKEKEKEISTAESSVSVWVIPTNEELMIARETAELSTRAIRQRN